MTVIYWLLISEANSFFPFFVRFFFIILIISSWSTTCDEKYTEKC